MQHIGNKRWDELTPSERRAAEGRIQDLNREVRDAVMDGKLSSGIFRGPVKQRTEFEMKTLSKLIAKSAAESGRALKPNTALLSTMLGLKVPLKHHAFGMDLISKEAERVLYYYLGPKQTRNPEQELSFVKSSSTYADIKQRLERVANQTEYVLDQQRETKMLRRLLETGKPIYESHGTDGDVKNVFGVDIEDEKLKSLKLIRIDGTFTQVHPGINDNESRKHKDVVFATKVTHGGYKEWTIETPKAIYTTSVFRHKLAREYEKMITSILDAEKMKDPGYVQARESALSTLKVVSQNAINTAMTYQGGMLSQMGYTPSAQPRDNGQPFFEHEKEQFERHVRDLAVNTLGACAEHNIPVIQTNRDADMLYHIDHAGIGADMMSIPLVMTLPKVGDTIHLTPNCHYLGEYQGMEECLPPHMEVSVLDAVGSGDNYMILTDAGLITTMDFESVERELHILTPDIDQTYSEQNIGDRE